MDMVGCTGIQAVVVSHWHHDHIGGVPFIQDILEDGAKIFKYLIKDDDLAYREETSQDPYRHWPKQLYTHIGDGDVLRTEGATLRFTYSPGHANDHLVAMLEEEQSMFSADNVLGEGSGVFNNLTQYLASLQDMYDESPTRVYPGHGPTGTRETILEYIKHRMDRVEQVRVVLASCPNDFQTLQSITRAIYGDRLNGTLFEAAMGNSVHVLEYLESQSLASAHPGNGSVEVRGLKRYKMCETSMSSL
mmetsp:Transcript_25474/g.41092  ORF Transcript_25474/g.41092 Transcript_25474/m.41092 type:complete len:247 (-) Transcript_25474:1610-2350(-)